MVLHKVKEVAKICGVSTSAIYKALKSDLDTLTTSPLDGQLEFGTVDNQSTVSGRVDNQSTAYTVLENGVTFITDDGLEYFKQRFSVSAPNPQPANDELVSSLLRQIDEKDRQLQERDTQINQLLEQSRNFQVLLKQEQDRVLLLDAPKRVGWFQRLFGSKTE